MLTEAWSRRRRRRRRRGRRRRRRKRRSKRRWQRLGHHQGPDHCILKLLVHIPPSRLSGIFFCHLHFHTHESNADQINIIILKPSSFWLNMCPPQQHAYRSNRGTVESHVDQTSERSGTTWKRNCWWNIFLNFNFVSFPCWCMQETSSNAIWSDGTSRCGSSSNAMWSGTPWSTEQQSGEGNLTRNLSFSSH